MTCRGRALSLGNAAHILSGVWNDIRRQDIPQPQGRATGEAAGEFGCITLSALAAELDRKLIAHHNAGQYRTGHDLWELYDPGPDEEIRNVIVAIDRRTRSDPPLAPVADILKKYRFAFSFRCPALSMTGPNRAALLRAHNVLAKAMDEPAFRQLCNADDTA